jgi:diaminopimelate epimerase
MQFTKMHGLGNDFVVLDFLQDALDVDFPKLAIELCDRHLGIGADGILLLLPSESADYRMRIFNPDGSEAENCGNGIRCLGRYYRDRYAPDAEQMRVETGMGPALIWVRSDGMVTVDMGAPIFAPAEIPVEVGGDEALAMSVDLHDREIPVGCVSMGNPHAVTFVAKGELDDYPLEAIGPRVEHYEKFPRRINFEAVEVIDPSRIRIRVWERGAGITLACGTGACASVVVAKRGGLVDGPVVAELPGGELTIEWNEGGHVLMTGPATYAFTGSVSIAAPVLVA